MQLAVGLAGKQGLWGQLCGNSGLKDVAGQHEVGLATERQKSDIDRKGLRRCLCDVGLRLGDSMNLRDMVMLVVGVWGLMVGLGGWLLHAE